MINKENIHKLLTKYLDNSLNEDEKAVAENWINANENNRAEFSAYRQIWKSSKNIGSTTIEVDTEAAWKKVHNRIGQAKVRRLNAWYKVAAAVAVISLLASTIYFLFNQNLHTIEHTAEENKTIELADQSIVELEKGSKLVYLENFNDDAREVKLVGTAQFDVEKSTKPFIIDAKLVEITVLGTSFLVEANEGDSLINVLVYSGKVAVKSKKTGEKVTLTKNQKAAYSIYEEAFHLDESNNRQLKFNHTPLEEVFDRLSKVFNVKIIVDQEAIQHCVFSGHFSTHDVNEIIKHICYSYGLSTENKENTHYISGKPNC